MGGRAGTAPDWLDACCWRCGSPEVSPRRDGRLLCEPCQRELVEGPASSETPFRIVRRLFWESHALERCWRCMDGPVDPEDDLGLCSRCR
jgi:hypothetical protein